MKKITSFSMLILFTIALIFTIDVYSEKEFFESLPPYIVSPNSMYLKPIPTTFEGHVTTDSLPVTLKVLDRKPVPGNDAVNLVDFEVLDSSFGPEKGSLIQGYTFSFTENLDANDTIFTYICPMNHWAYPENTYHLYESFFFNIENDKLIPPSQAAYSLLTSAGSTKKDAVQSYLANWITEKSKAVKRGEIVTYIDKFDSVEGMERAADVIITASVTDFDTPNDRIHIVKLELDEIIKGSEFDDSISYVFTSDISIQKNEKYMIFFGREQVDGDSENSVLIPIARQSSVVKLDSPEIAYLLE